MKFSVIDVTIPANDDKGSETILLEPGLATHIAIFTHGTVPTEGVDVKVSTNRGDEIIPFLPYQEFLPRGGGSHFLSTKEMPTTNGNQVLKVQAQATDNLAAAFKLRVIFYHVEEI